MRGARGLHDGDSARGVEHVERALVLRRELHLVPQPNLRFIEGGKNGARHRLNYTKYTKMIETAAMPQICQ